MHVVAWMPIPKPPWQLPLEDPRGILSLLCSEVNDLIGESSGVYGLHLNGDNSPWAELTSGGRFERLGSLNQAVEFLDRTK